VPPKTYRKFFGEKPPRAAKGGVVETGHKFDALNELMPHPIYAWMCWGQVLSPSEEMFSIIFEIIKEAHQAAVLKFNKRTANNSLNRTR